VNPDERTVPKKTENDDLEDFLKSNYERSKVMQIETASKQAETPKPVDKDSLSR